jgi:polyhydroxyalkanoate synthesis regulator phasin
MMKWGLGFVGLGVAGVIAVTALGFGGASAQTPSDQDGSRVQRYEEILAGKLGVTVDELHTAQKDARDQMIDEAVQAGKITPEQGEKLKSLDLGAGLRMRLGDGPGARIRHAIVDVFNTASDIVGVPVDQLRSRLQGGESLADIAQSQGISADSLQAQMVAKLTTDINQAVTDGKIDQPAADKLLSNLDQRVQQLINHEGGFGQMKGLRHHLPGAGAPNQN